MEKNPLKQIYAMRQPMRKTDEKLSYSSAVRGSFHYT